MQTPEQTKMTNPPKEQTKMQAPAPTAMKKERIRLIRAVSFSQKDKKETVLYDAGTVLDVTPATAHQLCDVKLGGHYNFSGERLTENAKTERHMIVRAVRAPNEELSKRLFNEQSQGDEGKLELAE